MLERIKKKTKRMQSIDRILLKSPKTAGEIRFLGKEDNEPR